MYVGRTPWLSVRVLKALLQKAVNVLLDSLIQIDDLLLTVCCDSNTSLPTASLSVHSQFVPVAVIVLISSHLYTMSIIPTL